MIVRGCSPEHFSLAHLPRLAAYLSRRLSRVHFVRSFLTRLSLASLSFRSALLCSAHAFALLVPRSRLCSSRASPSASSLLVPRLSSLPGSTPLISHTVRNFCRCSIMQIQSIYEYLNTNFGAPSCTSACGA